MRIVSSMRGLIPAAAPTMSIVSSPVSFNAGDAIAASPELAAVLDAIADGAFSPDDPGRFRHIADRIRYIDPYMIAADFAAYRTAQEQVEALWRRAHARGAKPPRSTSPGSAGSPSDRTIAEYAADIWHVPVAYR